MLYINNNGIDLLIKTVEQDPNKMVWVADPSYSKILYVSPSYENIFARKREALYENAQVWMDSIVLDEESDVIDKYAQRVFSNIDERDNTILLKIKKPDGTQCYCKDTNFSIYDQFGGLVSAAGVFEKMVEKEWIRAMESNDSPRVRESSFLMANKVGQYISAEITSTGNLPSVTVLIPGVKKDHHFLVKTRRDEISLTQREFECLQCLFSGMSAKVSAKYLEVAPKTVESCLARVIKKVGCANKNEITRFIPHVVY